MGISLGTVLAVTGAVIGGSVGGPVGAAAGFAIGSGIGGAVDSSNANSAALSAQTNAANNSLALQSQMYDQNRLDLLPYANAGAEGLRQQNNYLGFNGVQAQQDFINQVIHGPEYAGAVQEGNRAAMQVASATGNLRGGNLQAQQMMIGPQALAQLLNNRYNTFGGLVAAGQNSAAGMGAAGQNYANQGSNIYSNLGTAQAQSALAEATSLNNSINGLTGRYLNG